jgi:YD repeat-containing protein
VRHPGNGALYTFNNFQTRVVTPGVKTVEQRYASSVQYPDGETIAYTYDISTYPGAPYPLCGVPPTGNCQSFFRPTRISSTSGYYITITYQYAGTDVSNPLWSEPAEAALFSPSGTLIRRLDYSGATTIVDYGNSPTNPGVGRTFAGTGIENGMGANVEITDGSVTLPGESSLQLQVVGSSFPLVSSVTRDGVLWNYNYANARSIQIGANEIPAWDSVTVTGPDGYNLKYVMDTAVPQPYRNLIKTRVETVSGGLTRTTTFTYDYQYGDRIIGISMPEGNAFNVGYDQCGNILLKTTVAKAGSGLANVVESAVYPDNGAPEDLCPSVLNYLPTSYTDALNRVTNYQYNSDGQLTKELDPADQNGVQRFTSITYQASPAGISRKSLVLICKSSTADINTAACSGNALSHSEYTYVGDTNLPLTVMQKDEATGATRTTTYDYDAAGHVAMIDGPLTGTDDAKYFQYDTYGRKIWEVGERGPNGLRITKEYTYRDSDDKVIKVQTGTVSCTSGCDTASLTLTVLQQADTTYDSRRNPIRENTYEGTTTYSVTDHSFLDRGLADCTAVRMNLASLPSATPTGACSLGTQGSLGPDRITKNLYDSAGQLLQIQKAYGITGLQQNYATYTYTLNGKQQTVTDANGNEAQFVYDGFDRLYEWQFPSKTAPGTVDAADYEQYTYDLAGNRTCLRKRDGSKLTYTFDGLNRMTSKVVAATSGGSCP